MGQAALICTATTLMHDPVHRHAITNHIQAISFLLHPCHPSSSPAFFHLLPHFLSSLIHLLQLLPFFVLHPASFPSLFLLA
eukprot:m.178270 g.178270  ORF g.178270 m.178270 type:complete len:81 (+) comp16588_c1_seq7:219-461(+)